MGKIRIPSHRWSLLFCSFSIYWALLMLLESVGVCLKGRGPYNCCSQTLFLREHCEIVGARFGTKTKEKGPDVYSTFKALSREACKENPFVRRFQG